MKTMTQSPVMTPSILALLVLAVAITWIGATGRKIPVLTNVKLDIILLVIIGMAICTQGGIGRIAASGQWSHVQSIIGYVLGGSILLISLAVFAGWKLPMIQTERQALIAIAILAGLKVVNAVIHSVWSQS